MRRPALRTLAPLLLALLVSSPRAQAEQPEDPRDFHVLVFSRTRGYRHDSIPDGVAMFRRLARWNGFHVTATEDPAIFTDTGLLRFRVVVFCNTSGDVLDEEQQKALRAHVEGGGGFVGIHAASAPSQRFVGYVVVEARRAQEARTQSDLAICRGSATQRSAMNPRRHI